MDKCLNSEVLCLKSLLSRYYEISKDLSEARKDNEAEKKIVSDVSREIFRCSQLLESHAKYEEQELNRCLAEKNRSKGDEYFSNAFVLKRHFRRHVGDKPHECRICRKTFSQQRHLEMHYRVHSQDKSFACVSRENTSRQESRFKKHIYSQSKTFSSNVCKKPVKADDHVKTHFSTHARKRPFLSRTCKTTFKQKCELKKGIGTHVRDRQFSCKICEKAFKRKHHLERHFSAHTGIRPFSCSECEQAFKRKYHLKRHFKLHTRSNPYSCNKCMRVFNKKNHLKLHNLIHAQDRSFECEKYRKIFWLENLRRRFLIESQKYISLNNRRGKVIKQSANLKDTLCSNEEGRPFNSIACGKVLRRSYRIRKHLGAPKIDEPCPDEKVDRFFNHKCELPSPSNIQSKRGSSEFGNTKNPSQNEGQLDEQFSVDLAENSCKGNAGSKEVFPGHEVLIQRSLSREEKHQVVSTSVTDYSVNVLLNQQKSQNTIDSQRICSYCGEHFKRRGDLQRHLLVHRRTLVKHFLFDLNL